MQNLLFHFSENILYIFSQVVRITQLNGEKLHKKRVLDIITEDSFLFKVIKPTY